MKEYICIYDEDDMMYILNPYVAQNTELIRCKDCARGATCFTYRETGDDDGFCKWAERRPKTP